MEKISRDSPIPAYFQIARDLRNRLQRREWKTGDQMPTEPDLALQYNVSRVTLRQALAELSKDGLLVRRRGKGTYVNEVPQPIVHDLSLPIQYSSHLRKLGFRVSSQVLEQEKFDDPLSEVVEYLRIPADQPVTFLKRLLLINDQIVAINNSWISEAVAPGISEKELIDQSLSGTLWQRYNLAAARSENWLEVVRATEKDAKLLETSQDTPLILLSAVSFLSDDTALEYSITSWLGDFIRFHYSVDLKEGGSVVHLA